jgi:DNA-binding response OmpR family regulator
MKILLVDDDPDMLDITSYALHREGFTVILAGDGPHAIRRWQADEPDVVVTEARLPTMSGFDVCQQIRQGSSTPVIMLTELTSEDDIIKGFRVGADDYITKPFSPRQLAMRIQAVCRRGAKMGEREPVRQICVGDLVLDAESHEVRRGEILVSLTRLEFRMLYLLCSNPGRVISSTRLVDYAWGHEGGHPSLIKTHMSHIRAKLGLPARGPGSIEVIPMVGYRLTMASEGRRQPQPRSLTTDLSSEQCDVRSPLRVVSRDWTEEATEAGVHFIEGFQEKAFKGGATWSLWPTA